MVALISNNYGPIPSHKDKEGGYNSCIWPEEDEEGGQVGEERPQEGGKEGGPSCVR